MMDFVMCQKFAEAITIFLNQYKWLLDSYVIEFFTEDHWGNLPSSWQEALSETDPKQLGHILLNQKCWGPRCGAVANHSQDSKAGRNVNQIYPLSLLAFAAAAKALSLSRHPPSSSSSSSPSPGTHHACHDRHHQLTTPTTNCDLPTSASSYSLSGNGKSGSCSQVAGIEHRYRRHVKPKKQHEIKCLAEVVASVAEETNCHNVIDVGSGQGHLARFLAYNYGLDVTAVEAVGEHLTAAAKFDGEIEKDKAKESERRRRKDGATIASAAAGGGGEELTVSRHGTVRHVQSLIKPGCSIGEFLSQAKLTPPTEATPSSLKSPEEEESRRHILVGLHTCGDLGATMMRVFRESEDIAGLVSLGCCYMKLSSQEDTSDSVDHPSPSSSADSASLGYPLSDFVLSLLPSSSLSYEAREVACHSIDSYSRQLQQAGAGEGDLAHLKIHCHRAAMETVLRKNGMKRAQVRINKRVSKLPFQEYAQCVVKSVGLPPLREEEVRELSLLVDEEWRKVAMFFMLRLAMAPCVESLVLLDRANFLMEMNEEGRRHCHRHALRQVQARLLPIFDPTISPRNIALIAKNNSDKLCKMNNFIDHNKL